MQISCQIGTLHPLARIVPVLVHARIVPRYSDRDRGAPMIGIGSHGGYIHTQPHIEQIIGNGLYNKRIKFWGTISSSDGGDHPRSS